MASYLTQAGDPTNLQGLATKLNIPVGSLLSANPSLQNSDFAPGTNITLPASNTSATNVSTPVAPTTTPATTARQPAKPQAPAITSGSTQPPTQTQSIQDQIDAINKQALSIQKQLQSSQASGTDITSGTAARAVATDVQSQDQSQQSPIDVFASQQAGVQNSIDKLNQDVQNYQNFVQTQATPIDTYNQLLKSTGIQDEQLKLVNLQNIMNGTEQDVRNEITQNGGLADESQIQNIVSARNRTIGLQASSLANLINAQESQIQNIMNYTGASYKQVSDQFNTQFGLDQSVASLQAQMINTGFTKSLEYDRYLQSQQSKNRSMIQALASTNYGEGLAQLSDERLQQLSDPNNFASYTGYTYDDLVAMRDAAKSGGQAKLNNALLTAQAKQQANDSISQLGTMVANGTMAPPVSRTGSITAEGAKIIASAAQQNPNLNVKDMTLEWTADQRLVNTLSGQQFTNLKYNQDVVLSTIDNMRALSDALQRTGVTAFNKAQLYGLVNFTGGPTVQYTDPNTGKTENLSKGQLAAKYVTQVGFLQDDLAKAFTGTPTDKYLEQAQSVLNSDWSNDRLQASLDTTYDNMSYRKNIIQDMWNSVGVNQPGTGVGTASSTDITSLKSQYGISY